MPNNLPTEAGRSEPKRQAPKEALVDAINQVFTLFRLNYHNQYLKAFGNTEELNEVKRLWLQMLGRFAPETILKGARAVIENNEFLPTLRTMIQACERASQHANVPDAHTAYIEACRAPSPKAAYKWSHALVYHAGRQCDWYFLQSSAESVAYPVYRQKYNELVAQMREGVRFELPDAPELEQKQAPPLDKKTNKARLDALKSSLKL